MNRLVNFQRRLTDMFPGYFGGSTKHNHYEDFGWKEQLEFNDFYQMWRRNSVARAGVNKTISKTWETNPVIWETEDAGTTELEKAIRIRFEDLRIWQKLAIADARSMVGRYSAVLLRYADNKNWDQPVVSVPGGLDGFAGIIPIWEPQIEVAEYETDQFSENYGLPTMYEFKESSFLGQAPSSKPVRNVRIHPDRILIWSTDGTMDSTSALEAGFNDLVDIEKVKGAGAESFWKTSRGAPIIQAPEGMKQSDVARAMGVDSTAEVLDAVNEQIESFQKGFDKGLMLGGMTATPLSITLPNPEQFFTGPVQSFAASLSIPLKVLMGSQTGERSSTEDAKEWNRTIMSRREVQTLPLIRELIHRLELAGVLEERDWTIHWESLVEASADEKIQRAERLSNINKNMPEQPAFTWDEIRETAGYEPDIEQPEAADPPEDSEI